MSVRSVEGNLLHPFYHGVFRLVHLHLHWGLVNNNGGGGGDYKTGLGGGGKFHRYERGGGWCGTGLSPAGGVGQKNFWGSLSAEA